jgi:hypothetical protein
LELNQRLIGVAAFEQLTALVERLMSLIWLLWRKSTRSSSQTWD